MPYVPRRSRPKKAVAKKSAPRRRPVRKNPFKRSIVRMPTSFPQKLITKMRYAETLRLDPVVGLPSSYIFQANSIWDPNTSGTGHQPYTRDEYTQLYTYYRVLKSKISATFIPSVAGPAGAMVCGVSIHPDTTTVTSFDTIRETKGAHYKICAGDSNKVTVTNGYNAKKMFASNMGSLNALMSSNPGEGAYFHVFVTNANGAGDGATVDIVVTIEYTVLLWELKILPQS